MHVQTLFEPQISR